MRASDKRESETIQIKTKQIKHFGTILIVFDIREKFVNRNEEQNDKNNNLPRSIVKHSTAAAFERYSFCTHFF